MLLPSCWQTRCSDFSSPYYIERVSKHQHLIDPNQILTPAASISTSWRKSPLNLPLSSRLVTLSLLYNTLEKVTIPYLFIFGIWDWAWEDLLQLTVVCVWVVPEAGGGSPMVPTYRCRDVFGRGYNTNMYILGCRCLHGVSSLLDSVSCRRAVEELVKEGGVLYHLLNIVEGGAVLSGVSGADKRERALPRGTCESYCWREERSLILLHPEDWAENNRLKSSRWSLKVKVFLGFA